MSSNGFITGYTTTKGGWFNNGSITNNVHLNKTLFSILDEDEDATTHSLASLILWKKFTYMWNSEHSSCPQIKCSVFHKFPQLKLGIQELLTCWPHRIIKTWRTFNTFPRKELSDSFFPGERCVWAHIWQNVSASSLRLFQKDF